MRDHQCRTRRRVSFCFCCSYVAIGLSHDDSMGGDLTAACFQKSGSEVDVQAGFNVGKSNRPLTKSRLTLANPSGSVSDGVVSCTFKRPSFVDVPEHGASFNLESEKSVQPPNDLRLSS